MKYAVKKICTLIITLLLISMITFAAFSVIPGDAALAKSGTNATPERVEALREELGLNDTLVRRYGHWLFNVFQGDFGESYQYTGHTVQSLLADRLPISLLLTLMVFVLILAVSIPLGLWSAKRKGSWVDKAIHITTQVTMAIPPFFLGILLTFVFGVLFSVFQPGQFVSPKENMINAVRSLIFPALAIAIPKIAMVVKFVRNSVLSENGKDYVRTARSKGNTRNQVLYGHILKNALIPVITFIAIVVAEIFAGSIVVEQVFDIPGLGRLLVTAIANRDFPVVQASVLCVTAAVIILNSVVDILYRFADPRVQGE